MYKIVSTKKYVLLTNEERRLERALADQELITARVAVNAAEKKIAQLEKLLEWTQLKYEEALERADRQLDGILAQAGLPEVTATVKREHVKRDTALEQENKRRAEEVAEIFSESIGDMELYDHLGLPSELKEDAAKMMLGAK